MTAVLDLQEVRTVPPVVNVRPAPIVVSLVSTTARPQVLADWRAFELTIPDVPLAVSADWTECWLNHYGDWLPHQFVRAERDGRTIGLGLLVQAPPQRIGPFSITRWHWGTAGEPDRDSVCVEYNGLLCAPADREAFLTALVARLQQEAAWDEFCLDGFAAQELPSLPVVDNGSGTWRTVRKAARFMNLDQIRESGQDTIHFFGDSTRKAIRQNLRDYGTIAVDWSRSIDEAHALFQELIALHQARWTSEGQPGCYSSCRFTSFHHELLERLIPTARMALVRVRAGDKTLGCSQLLFDRERALVYQGGRLPMDGKHSPGLITDYSSLEACVERGFRAFDFMAGDSIHKQRLTNTTADLVWATLRRPRPKFLVIDAIKQLKRGLTGWWKRASRRTRPTTTSAAAEGPTR